MQDADSVPRILAPKTLTPRTLLAAGMPPRVAGALLATLLLWAAVHWAL